MYYKAEYASPLGNIQMVCGESQLVALWLPGQKPFPHPALDLPHPILAQTARWLDRYFAGEGPAASELPLKPAGSAFRQLVWELLLEIPYGQSTTYGQLAREAAGRLGKAKMSAQAVGGAVGANPIAVIIPCHRVLGAGGQLTGYAGGLAYKRRLLALENIPFRD